MITIISVSGFPLALLLPNTCCLVSRHPSFLLFLSFSFLCLVLFYSPTCEKSPYRLSAPIATVKLADRNRVSFIGNRYAVPFQYIADHSNQREFSCRYGWLLRIFTCIPRRNRVPENGSCGFRFLTQPTEFFYPHSALFLPNPGI